ncbi:DUF2829 domain-containing protein [Liquorilactobacillus uvarum]|uniref:Thoeris anti-defense 2-like domain-containing protein n=1 Tax=Liquorilactobacillus uvarum DSM 19971 TaxID=1423812 RepID=A0A0R1PW38_9LACO|nr:DUF2829 domain-containing protein [Liquorilactobacillus uvarum]KRL36606.1 hypothetical protein FD20_GL001148 [Liquorilactobacillus uvarum DSM 19971]
MNFGKAIEALKQGYKVARKGWNGKNQYIQYIPSKILNKQLKHDEKYTFSDVLAIKTSNDVIQVGWLATQTDMLAQDWEILPAMAIN